MAKDMLAREGKIKPAAVKGPDAGARKGGGAAAEFLETAVRVAARKAARTEGMEMTHFLQKAVETYLLATRALEGDLAERITAKRTLIDTAVTKAREIDANGGFDEHFVLTVLRSLTSTDSARRLYETATGGALTDDKAPRRAGVNQQLARVIKAAVGARAKRNDKGKLARAQVTGEVVTSYTLLEK
ncbi:hypothetical protein [Pseudooceanicola sp.]|uniref:hypothetical protein n=1 Tax=Pseudooceanicola sp. TaxID=1914328 RepID=UPI00260E6E38|nr:hypothetical protein [Pseudooceanicola sp.]MDF1856862.1 hypothetical protein [Pseudooceanicola sp.]